MSVNFRGNNGFNQTFFNQHLQGNARLKDGTGAAERLGDNILSKNDLSSIQQTYVEQAVQAGARPADAQAEFESFLADALDGQLDQRSAAGILEGVRRLTATHDSEPLALQFKDRAGNAGTPSLNEPSGVRTVDSQPGVDEKQIIGRFNTDIRALNTRIAKRNELSELIDIQRNVLNNLHRIPTPVKVPLADGQVREFQTKEAARQFLEGNIPRLQQERAPYLAEKLDEQLQSKYRDALSENGPVAIRTRDILQEIGQLRQDPEMNRILAAIEVAEGNHQSTVSLDGQTYDLATLKENPKFKQLTGLLQELDTLTHHVRDWSTYVPRNTQDELNKAGALVEAKGVLDAFKSKAGLGNYFIPDLINPATTGTQNWRDVGHNLMGFLGTLGVPASIINALPDSAKTKLAEMLAKVAGKYGAKGIEKFGQMLTSKLGGALISGYGAVYYGSIATGLNYPNVQIGQPPILYELRPSETSRALAAVAAGLDAGSAVASATGAGAPLGAALSIAGMFAETATEFSLLQDQEKLEVVHNCIMIARNGTELREGLAKLTQQYGSLDNIQNILGEVPVHQTDNPPQWKKGDVATTAEVDAGAWVEDRELGGVVMNKLLEFAVKGEISPQEAQQHIGSLLKGLDERLTSDDDVVQSMVQDLALRFGSGDKLNKALEMLGSDIRLKLFKILDEGWTQGGTSGADRTQATESDIMEALARTETDPHTRGKMVALLLEGNTVERFENLAFELIEKTRNEALANRNPSVFHDMLNHVKIDGQNLLSELTNELSPQRAGKIIAWMVQSGASQSQIDDFVREASATFKTISPGDWFTNDDITRAFIEEAKGLNLDLSAMSTDSMKDLYHTLDNWRTRGVSVFSNTQENYNGVAFLAKFANLEAKKYMIEQMMSGKTFDEAEKAIVSILEQTPASQRAGLFAGINARTLGSELENTGDATKVIQLMLKAGLSADKINQFVDGVGTQGWFNGKDDDMVRSLMGSLSDAEVKQLPDAVKLRFFKALDAGDTSIQEYGLMKKLGNAASPETKASLITYLMEQEPTLPEQEAVIYDILLNTPYERNEFISVLNNLDTGRLAEELESDTQAAAVTVWIAKACHQAGQGTGKLESALLKLAEQHREGALNSFLDNGDINANGRELYKKIPPSTLLNMAQKLMAGETDEAEEDCIMKILDKTSWEQLREVFNQGGNGFIDNMLSELDVEDYGQIMGWMAELGQSSRIEYMFDKIAGSQWFIDTTSDDAALALTSTLSNDTLNKMPKSVLGKLHSAMDDGWTTYPEYAAMARLKGSSNW